MFRFFLLPFLLLRFLLLLSIFHTRQWIFLRRRRVYSCCCRRCRNCLNEKWERFLHFQYLENKINIFVHFRIFSVFIFRVSFSFTIQCLLSHFSTWTLIDEKFVSIFAHFQAIWVCILCRKKQELLSKTGQWINKAPSPDGNYSNRSIGGIGVSLLDDFYSHAIPILPIL